MLRKTNIEDFQTQVQAALDPKLKNHDEQLVPPQLKKHDSLSYVLVYRACVAPLNYWDSHNLSSSSDVWYGDHVRVLLFPTLF